MKMPRTASVVLLWSGLLFASSAHDLAARRQAPSATELLNWLDNRDTAWLATVHLQAVPDEALTLLLRPGRAITPASGDWTAPMLALAKLGDAAIAPITERALAITETAERASHGTVSGLIRVLGSIGPAAVPALVHIADASTDSPAPSQWLAFQALQQIISLEPRTGEWGQLFSPWRIWRPVDGRLDALGREAERQLPHLRQLMQRTPSARISQRPAAHLAAAYLLARWGEADDRGRALGVLVDMSRREDPEDYFPALRLLHALGASETGALIRLAASRLSGADQFRGQRLLGMAITLHQIGERDYTPLVAEALRDALPHVRLDAVRFVAESGDLALAPLLLPAVRDQTNWNGHTVGSIAVQSLERVTLERFGDDEERWRRWLEANTGVSRAALVDRRVRDRLQGFRAAPIWDVNLWLDEFSGSDGAGLFPLIDRYLRRPDLDAGAIGPGTRRARGGLGPAGMYGPHVVTMLLDMALRGVAGALERLHLCLVAADRALAIAAFDRERAVEHLATEARSTEAWRRSLASEFLLMLGDKRGVPARLEMLADVSEPARLLACRDLRVYTQQPLPCDAKADSRQRAAEAAAWHAWWTRAEPTFEVRSRQAAIDLEASPWVPAVDFQGGDAVGLGVQPEQRQKNEGLDTSAHPACIGVTIFNWRAL
jgi:hypothetical protein